MTTPEQQAEPVRRTRKRVREPALPVYVVGRKPLRVGSKFLQPGEVVPDAHKWPRVESWVRTGWLKVEKE